MSEGFTPGPWALRRSRTGSGHTHIECPADESMALFKRAEDSRLFIAAPELLEALEALTANYADVEPGGSKNVDKARAAIAKAKGQ